MAFFIRLLLVLLALPGLTITGLLQLARVLGGALEYLVPRLGCTSASPVDLYDQLEHLVTTAISTPFAFVCWLRNNVFRHRNGLRRDQALQLSIANAWDPPFLDLDLVPHHTIRVGASALRPNLDLDDPDTRLQVDLTLASISALTYETDQITRSLALSSPTNSSSSSSSSSPSSSWEFTEVIPLAARSTGHLAKGVYRARAVILVSQPDHTAVVAFRGTQPLSLAQWLTDFTVPLVSFPSNSNSDSDSQSALVRVHKGFLTALGVASRFASSDDDDAHDEDDDKQEERPLFDQLINQLTHLVERQQLQHIYITGHSMGAAMARLFAYSLRDLQRVRHLGARIRYVCTFGTPRQGNSAYALRFDNHFKHTPVRAVVNAQDLVARLPIGLACFPYSPAIDGCYYMPRVMPAHELRPFEDVPWPVDPIRQFSDHFPSAYVHSIVRAIKEIQASR